MTAIALGTDPRASADLEEFGYEQQLHRSIGTYASFAAGFSFVSILTTIFQLFGFGYSFAGPVFFWTWPAVFLGQLTVALCFAELAARYPISGAIYQWSRRLGGHIVGWFAGWTMILAQIVTVAAAAIAMQAVLPEIWSGFQLVGGSPFLNTPTGATNAVILGVIVLTITTIINAAAVRVMAIVNSIGVTAEIIGVILLSIALFSHAKRGPGIVLNTSGLSGTLFGSLLVASLMAAYVMVGFDSAGELSEETHNPRRTAPRTIIRALTVSAAGGTLILVGALMASPEANDPNIAGQGLAYVITSRLGDTLGRVFLADVVLAAFVCTLAIQTATTRMIFSMSRDEVLPFSKKLGKVSKNGATAVAAVVVGVLAVALLVVNLGNTGVFTALTSVCIVLLYLAYLMVTVPMLIRRINGTWKRSAAERSTMDETGRPLFSLGRFGFVINLIAVLFGVAMMVNLAWPRSAVYNPSGDSSLLQNFALVCIAVALGGGFLVFTAKKKAYRAAIGHTDLAAVTGNALAVASGAVPSQSGAVPSQPGPIPAQAGEAEQMSAR